MINKLEKWLKKPGNTKSKLAAALGYQTTSTIERWFINKAIPKNRVEQVLKFIEEN